MRGEVMRAGVILACNLHSSGSKVPEAETY